MLDTAPLYDQVADQIHALIRAGTLRAGERVPSVRRLSQQQGVSVSTVLQAYQKLEDSGVIEARPQSGYYVKRAHAPVAEPAPSRPPQRAIEVEVNALADVMLAAGQDPKMVSFGSACPAGDMFPLERIRRVLSARARRDRHALGRYGLPPGTEALRARGARWNGAAASITATW
jgi:DNA-binding transcriptional MocR family regulator